MTSMIDPRPLEPSWVYEVECPDIAEWTVIRRKWNKETRKYDAIKSCDDGNMIALLAAVAEIIKGNDPECEIEIDASNIAESILPPTKITDYGVDLGNGRRDLWWTINPSGILDDSGGDVHELMGSIEYLANKGEKFTVEISYYDPTPQYMEIGTML